MTRAADLLYKLRGVIFRYNLHLIGLIDIMSAEETK
jgi:hypothetical protein